MDQLDDPHLREQRCDEAEGMNNRMTGVPLQSFRNAYSGGPGQPSDFVALVRTAYELLGLRPASVLL